MKQLAIILLVAICVAGKAQTEFKFVTGTPIREYHEVTAVYKNGYILKYTNMDAVKGGTGKFVQYSTDNKLITQKPYKVELGFKTMFFVDLMVLGDNKTWLTYGGSPGGSGAPYTGCTMRWSSRVKDYSIQPFDLKTLQTTGTPKVVGIDTKKDIGTNSFIHSPEGNRMAIMASEYNTYGPFKYKLMDASGTELFTKDYTIPYIKDYASINERSVKMNEAGDLVFMIADYRNDKSPDAYLGKIDASGKLYTKKLDSKGKFVSKYATTSLAADGSVTLTMEVYKGAKDKEAIGELIQKFSPSLEMVNQSEVTYPELPGNSGMFKKLDGGGYVLIKKETGQRQTGPQKWDDTYSSYTCTGYNDKMEELYKYDVHKVDKSSTWCIYRPDR